MSPELSRRTLLGSAAGAAMLSALPLSVQTALAAPAKPGRLEDIQHVVILMQENRAFDHYFGTMSGIRGFGDRTAVRGINGRPVFDQPDASRKEGYLSPFAMNAAHTNAYRQGAPAFGYVDSMGARNDGIADGYVSGRGGGWLGQGYYEPADMPFYNALASVFTICDHYHASMETSTNPNREHFMTGTSGGTVRDVVVHDNTETADGYEWTTYAERLERAGVSWRTYQAHDNFDDNALAWFAAFHRAKPGEPLYERGLRMVGDAAHSGDPFAMGDALVAAFAADVRADTLPQVSWLVAPAALSEHADYAPPNGEDLTARLLGALADNPEVWAKTVFILNYDEHGGFFDHLLPPVPPVAAGRGASTVSPDGEVVMRVTKDGKTYHRLVSQHGKYRVKAADGSLTWSDTLPAGESVVSGPYPLGLGTRVPMIVASPWTRGGVVDSTVFDHTSVIRFLERRFGVREPNISAWRREVTGDLLSVFDFSGDDPVWPALPDTSGNRKKAEDAGSRPAPTVPSPQSLPRQQRGTRPARALPYALRVRPQVRRGRLELDFRNRGRQGAVLAAYPAPGGKPRFYTVGAQGRLSDTWTIGDEGYDLRVHGPSGSLWHFRGAAQRLEAQLTEDTGHRRVEIELTNEERAARTFLVGDLAYGDGIREVRVGRGDRRTVTVRTGREGWYDLAVTTTDDVHFLRRFAGRIADRRPGVTDPAMGLPDALAATVRLASASTTIDEAILVPGKAARVSATLTATSAAGRVEARLVVPPGWSVRNVTAAPSALAAGASGTAVWDVTPPASLPAGGTHRLLVVSRARAGDRLALAEAEIAARTAPSMAGHLLGEDFESLAGALKPAVDRGSPADLLGWTAAAPAGWTVTNAAAMPQGTRELQGWTFMTKRFWSTGGQDRAGFTRGLGIVAVADPDDWDDTGAPSAKGRFDSTLASPAVAVPAGATTLHLGFDSHYRQEAPQTATVTAVFDTGEERTLLTYSSAATGNDNAGQDMEDRFVTRELAVPAGARSVTLKFRMFNAGNNWYWAIDHVRLDTKPITG
ncbi:phosphocholine-specific phospholipase C [Streptomyces sp. RKAG293]|uniref:phosphocholine-specific phospholipase C n=1 Tax=Streptomyces sp. RKAG293 TaxID=2893403 RepID=UPI0020348EFE|nr:phospholipase C, phosphocholine-specific [Streptomyces sp. RKAG293]MCM2419377.1 phospholipase C, phosphocholine-specific [Streptomyces sp. RKAG293]